MVELENPDRNPGPSRPRLQALAVGAGVGLGIAAGKTAGELLRTDLGWWPVFAVECVLAGVVGGVIVWTFSRLAR